MLSKDVTKRVLHNGATLLVREAHSLPILSILVYVKCGYLHESDHEVGLAHLIEHILVSGVDGKQGANFMHKMRALGGGISASTSYLHTCYSAVLSSENWRRGLELMACMLQKSSFSYSVLQNEIEIILHEIRRKQDSPRQMGKESLYELAYENHRIRRWRLGSEKYLKTLTVDDLQAFYNKYYCTENLVWAIVGDVDKEEMFAEANKNFTQTKKSAQLIEPQPVEASQKEFRFRQVYGDVNTAYLYIGFRIENQPEVNELIALESLAIILEKDGGRYLNRNLGEEIVRSASATYISFGQARMFLIEAECSPTEVEKACLAIFRAIGDIRQGHITEQAALRGRDLLEYRHLHSLQFVENQAWMLACCEANGDYQTIDTYSERLASITALDITRVAATYFNLQSCNLLACVPWHIQLTPPDVSKLSSFWGNNTLSQRGDLQKYNRTGKISFSYKERSKINEADAQYHLLDGITIIVKQNSALPLVSCGVFAKHKIYEPVHYAGISEFMLCSALSNGSDFSASELHFDMEQFGCRLSKWNERDGMGFVINVHEGNLEIAFQILSGVIRSPVFNESFIEKEKTNVLAKMNRSSPSLFDLIHSALFDGHPYGLPRFGFSETVKNFTRALVQEWHKKHFYKNNLIFVFVGNITMDRALELVGTCLDELDDHCNSTPDIPNLPEFIPHLKYIEHGQLAQTYLSMGFRAPSYSDPLFYAFMILESLLARNTGRLLDKLRKNGLAYSANGAYLFYKHSGAFIFNASTLPQWEERVVDELLQEFEKLNAFEFEEDEVRIATDQVIGQYQISRQANELQLYRFAHNEILGGKIDEVSEFPQRLKNVTREEIAGAVRQYFDTKRYALAVLRGKK